MNIEKQIEFDKVKEIWMNLAVTEAAKEQIREIIGQAGDMHGEGDRSGRSCGKS